MNKALYDQANQELEELLKKNPELLDIQAELCYNLAMMGNKIERAWYTQELMLDKLDELRALLEAVSESYN